MLRNTFSIQANLKVKLMNNFDKNNMYLLKQNALKVGPTYYTFNLYIGIFEPMLSNATLQVCLSKKLSFLSLKKLSKGYLRLHKVSLKS